MALTVSEAIESLRSELAKAQQNGEGKDLRFTVQEVELELDVLLDVEADGKAKANVWLVAGEVKGKVSNSHAHKLKIKLQPLQKGNQPLEVSGTSSQPSK